MYDKNIINDSKLAIGGLPNHFHKDQSGAATTLMAVKSFNIRHCLHKKIYEKTQPCLVRFFTRFVLFIASIFS